MHPFAQADVSLERVTSFPGGMLQYISLSQSGAQLVDPALSSGSSKARGPQPPPLWVLTFKAFFAASAPARLSKVTKPTG